MIHVLNSREVLLLDWFLFFFFFGAMPFGELAARAVSRQVSHIHRPFPVNGGPYPRIRGCGLFM